MSDVSVGYELARFVIDFISVVKRGDVEWQQKQLDELAELKKRKKIHQARLEHELNLLQVKFKEEIARKQEEERRITNDYKDFLDSIDEMKKKMLDTFEDMPKPMVYVIHHHAKHMIDEIWKNQDEHAQAISRVRFAEFLTAVYRDTTNAMLKEDAMKMPTETLKYIRGPN